MTDVDDSSDVARITIQPYRGALIASIQVDFEERVLRRFQSDLLECVRSSGAETAIIDLSGVDVMDAQDFGALRRIIDMVSLMGSETILCGIQPGVAASLVYLNVPLDDLKTSRNLDAALAALDASASRDEEVQAPDEPEDRDRDVANGSEQYEVHDSE